MKATRSCVPFRMSASRAVPVAKPSFSRAERIASITSSRELKIAARAGDVRGATAGLLSPLQADSCEEGAGHQRALRSTGGARRGTDASCDSTRETDMHQRRATYLH